MKSNDEEEEIEVEIEINDKQADFLEKVLYDFTFKGVKKTVVIGGVGSGKTVTSSILAAYLLKNLPRSKGQYACPAVSQTKRSITPTLKKTWREFMFWTEYDETTGEGDFVLWKKPPKHWPKTYEEPDDWKNCITHESGSVLEVCGYRQDPDAHRSRNDDWAVIEEGSRFKKDWLKIVEGRVRANVGKYDSLLHHLISIFSNPNYDPNGDWMWDIEEWAFKQPDRYAFFQTCTMDNIDFLPAGYVEDKKASMHDLEYRVEVLGERITRIKNSYYASLNWDHHAYDDAEPLYKPDMPIVASLDFNVNFTSSTLYIDYPNRLDCFTNVFVKEPRPKKTMAESLALVTIEKLHGHINKRIVVTGDRNGLNTSAGSRLKLDGKYETQYDQYCQEFIDAGWYVDAQPLSYNPNKSEHFTFMEDVLLENGREDFTIRFDRLEAKQTLISMTFTPIAADFSKDKRSERRKGIEQENATHLGDTVDYACIWKKNPNLVFESGGFDIEFY
jgi:hypothetical protein